jgi:TctA family transporter
MELSHSLALGLHAAFSAASIGCCVLGVTLGTLIGALPGLGPMAVIAMLLPMIRALEPTQALILLAGVYYGAQYAGSTAAILINVPGEPTSAVTAIDGHQMARQGRARSAMAVATLGSFFAGCVGTAMIVVLAAPLTEIAFRFGAPEYLSLMVLGLVGAVVLASGSLLKGLAMTLLGLLLAQVNVDALSGVPRFSFGLAPLATPEGLGFGVMALGLFAVGEVLVHLGRASAPAELAPPAAGGGEWPTRRDLAEATPSVLRGTVLGTLLGWLPGGGAALASFIAYGVEKQVVRAPRIAFGRGAVQGVAAPEAANNAGAQSAFIPLLALGIPPNAVMALLAGALLLKGVRPGPDVMSAHPLLFWGLVASMWLGNALLVLLNLPVVRLWARLLTLPYRWLFPAAIVVCAVGAYGLKGSAFQVELVALVALAGYGLQRLGCDPAPLLLGYVMQPLIEDNLRRTLLLSGGDWRVLLGRPLSAGLLFCAVVLIVVAAVPAIRSRREEAFHED